VRAKIQICGKQRLLALSIGLVYLWFGALKFFPGISPAEELAVDTIQKLFLGIPSRSLSLYSLAILEVGIGIFLLINYRVRLVILVALAHLVMTFTPLIFFPELSFNSAPVVPTMIGQYIAKNIIIMAALWLIYPGKSENHYTPKVVMQNSESSN